ncbi:MAG: type VI secretion system baseplate subunit TssK [Planctomycetes bacterium]|nr:type VI secretion system baseplate subunit TssK [Planctomycetota bacterium]
MSLSDRVLWEEGMFLGPQHFQQAERHLLQQLHGRLHALAPRGFGLTRLVIDDEALAGGELALRQITAVLPDGTFVEAPEVAPLPRPRPLRDVFGAQKARLAAYLGVASQRIGSLLSRDDAAWPGRYRRRMLQVLDEDKGAIERDVAVGELDLRFLFEGETMDGMQTLPIARLVRGAGAQVQQDAAYVPPLLWTGASPRLAATVRKLLEYVTSKAEELARKRGQAVGGRAQFTAAEAAGFSLLHTLHTWLPILGHHHLEPRQHPEQLYRDLASFVGALATYAGERAAAPAYDHLDPGPVFARLEQLVFDLSQWSAPETCASIPLRQTAPGEYGGQILDDSLFGSADFYFAFAADVAVEEIIREFPFAAKIGSPEGVALARSQAVRGVRVTHMPSPPNDIPQRSGFHYFVVNGDDAKWQAVREGRALAVYLPPKFQDPKLELYAVRKSS